MKKCKGMTARGFCRNLAEDGRNYCAYHAPTVETSGDQVAEIRIASKELTSGQVIRRKPLTARPRVFKRNRFERDGWGNF